MDVSFLDKVFAASGPYATVCADVTHTTENADTELDLRVRAVSDRLTEQGAPEAVVESVRARLLEGNDGGEAGTLTGRALVVASDGSVVLDHALVGAPTREVAEWSPQPALLAVLRQLPGRVPHIVVLTDRSRRRHHLRRGAGNGRGGEDRRGGDLPDPQVPGGRLGAPPLPAQRREQVGPQRRGGRHPDLLDGPQARATVRPGRR
jgi:hypothetical protein